MKKLSTFLAVLIGLLLETGLTTTVNVPDFDHYRVILERRPFGEIAPSEEVAAPAPSIAGSFAGQFDLRAIIDEGENLRVGLMHKAEQRHFYINLGETVDGIELVSVDYEGESAVLRKGDETIIFNLRQPTDAAMATASAPAPPPFQTLSRPQATGPSTSAAPRRPFFAEMRRRRTPRGEQADVPVRTDPAGSTGMEPDTAAGNQPRPFGPFTPVSGTNVPGVFGQPLKFPQPSGETNPFFQFSPTQSGMEAQGFGVTIENMMPDDDLGEVPLHPVSGPHPFQMIQQFPAPLE